MRKVKVLNKKFRKSKDDDDDGGRETTVTVQWKNIIRILPRFIGFFFYRLSLSGLSSPGVVPAEMSNIVSQVLSLFFLCKIIIIQVEAEKHSIIYKNNGKAFGAAAAAGLEKPNKNPDIASYKFNSFL